MRTVLLLCLPAIAWADVAPTPDCGCAVPVDPLSIGVVVAALALVALGRRR